MRQDNQKSMKLFKLNFPSFEGELLKIETEIEYWFQLKIAINPTW